MYDVKMASRAELEGLLRELGQPAFRAGQIERWLLRGATDFTEMSDLPASLRSALAERCEISRLCPLRRSESADGTVKFLWELFDRETVETVVMQYQHGNTVCISTQVGCRQGCAFCASTRGGLRRNLSAFEMYDEVLMSGRESGLKISNVVLMGIGEPLENLDNVLGFFSLLGRKDGLDIGMRHISLSTCGPEGGIERLAEHKLQLTLSVSLHAPNDELRSRLMPVNRKSGGVEKLVARCNAYREATGRRVSYEYLLADGVNDSDADAEALARLIRGSDAHVNLIPLNRVDGAMLEPSPPQRVESFKRTLERRGVNVTVRRRMGADIDAACGQLRMRAQNSQSGGEKP